MDKLNYLINYLKNEKDSGDFARNSYVRKILMLYA